MKIGILSASNVQATLIQEELQQVVEHVKVFSARDIAGGAARSTNQHVMVYDLSDASLLDCDELVEQMHDPEQLALYNEVDLYSMSPEQRSAWRKKMVVELKKLAPDLASEIMEQTAGPAASKVPTLVIGSSSGGPSALKDLLSRLPQLNVAIFVAQHMAEDAFSLLLKQVTQAASSWDVAIARQGQKVLPGSVIIVPRGVALSISAGSVIELRPNSTQPEFDPCINQCIRSVHAYSKENTSVVILSGMGSDGAAGVRDVQGNARLILAQDAESCGTSSMPDAARATGAVNHSGTPAELADLIASTFPVM